MQKQRKVQTMLKEWNRTHFGYCQVKLNGLHQALEYVLTRPPSLEDWEHKNIWKNIEEQLIRQEQT